MNQDERKKQDKKPNLKRKNDQSKPPRRDPSKTIVMWLLVGVAVVLGLRFINEQSGFKEVKLTYSEFQRVLESDAVRITQADIIQQGEDRAELHGQVADESSWEKIKGLEDAMGNKHFRVNLPFVDSQMLARWDQLGIQYDFQREQMKWGDMVISLLPWLLMIFIWVFMIRQMQSGQKGIFSFGKSRAKMAPIDRPKVTFADAAGVEEAKAELEEIIEFLKDPKKFKILGGKIPKGMLLLGPPGTGKTLLARCVAGEAGVPFLSMSGSDFVEMFVGVGASRVRDLFETAKRNAPCIVFIDEIDAVGRQRGAGLGGGHDEREQTLNQMLVEMDGFEENSGVILIAATNRPDVLDPALLRPGRFDRQVIVDAPDVRGREGILKVHVKNTPMSDDVDLKQIARGTPGFVGADLANLVNEAALMAARFGQKQVTMLDFEEAKDKVIMGPERKSMVMSDKEKKTTAFHEAGHAICSLYCPETDPLHKVTIIPRGRALGVTFSLPEEDRHNHTREYILDKICMSLGGRVAEEIIFNRQTSGAYNDIKQATKMARHMICDLGMSEELGPISYGEKDDQVFLGREITRNRDYSEHTAEQIDRLMRKVVDEQLQRARSILTEHRNELELLANALLEHELLDREEIRQVISGKVLEMAKKSRSLPPRKSPSEQDTEQQPQQKDESSSSVRADGGDAESKPEEENDKKSDSSGDSV